MSSFWKKVQEELGGRRIKEVTTLDIEVHLTAGCPLIKTAVDLDFNWAPVFVLLIDNLGIFF